MIEAGLTKSALRKELLLKLEELAPEDFVQAGEAIAKHIANWLDDFKNTADLKVGSFASFKNEADTSFLHNIFKIKHIKKYLPILNTDLEINFSVPIEQINIIFMPGLAFAKDGTRLGRGAGSYDKFLQPVADFPIKPLLVGLALDLQILPSIPSFVHDIPVDYVCTPNFGLIKTLKREK